MTTIDISATIVALTQAQDIAAAISNEDHGSVPATILADAIVALLDRAGRALEVAAGERAGHFSAVV